LAVEQALTQITGVDLPRGTASISIPVAGLAPAALTSEFDWIVRIQDPTGYEFVLGLVEDYGMPFQDTHDNLTAGLNAAWENNGHSLEFRIPIFLHLLGDTASALTEVDKLDAPLAGQEGVWPEFVQAYARGFREYVQVASAPPTDAQAR
jgi:hypothetical protein